MGSMPPGCCRTWRCNRQRQMHQIGAQSRHESVSTSAKETPTTRPVPDVKSAGNTLSRADRLPRLARIQLATAARCPPRCPPRTLKESPKRRIKVCDRSGSEQRWLPERALVRLLVVNRCTLWGKSKPQRCERRGVRSSATGGCPSRGRAQIGKLPSQRRICVSCTKH